MNVDWAGVLVERVSGLKLNDYFQQHIFDPLELKNISMFPSEAMKRNLAYMNQRAPDGTLSKRSHPQRLPLTVSTEEEKKAVFNSGGGGCFANPQDYTRKQYKYQQVAHTQSMAKQRTCAKIKDIVKKSSPLS